MREAGECCALGQQLIPKDLTHREVSVQRYQKLTG